MIQTNELQTMTTTKKAQDTPEYTAEYLQRILDRINEVHNDPYATDETLSKMRAEAGKIDAFFANATDAMEDDVIESTEGNFHSLPRDMTEEEVQQAEKEGRVLIKIEENDYGICYYYYYLINGKEEKVNFNIIKGIHTGACKQHIREEILRNILNDRSIFILNDIEAERRALIAETQMIDIEHTLANFARLRALQDELPPEQFAKVVEVLGAVTSYNDGKITKEWNGTKYELHLNLDGVQEAVGEMLQILDSNTHMRLEYYGALFDVMDEYNLREKYKKICGEGYGMADANKLTDALPKRMHNALKTLMHYLQTTADKEALAKIIKQWEDGITAVENMLPNKKEYNKRRKYYLKNTTEYDKKTRTKK